MTRSRRLFFSCVALLFLWANVAGILRGLPSRPGVPMPPGSGDALRIFGVFSGAETVNRELVVEVYAEPEAGRPAWVRLDAAEFVPFALPERNRRLWADRVVGPFSFGDRAEARAFFARRILERCRRTHPGLRATEVRVGELTWPRRPGPYGPPADGPVEARVVYGD